jgi:serine/threonine protein kinase
MEFYDFDLMKLLSNKVNLINGMQAKTLIYNLLLAVKFLHSTGIMHRDLKPSNILITEKCTIKICDFGFARNYATKESHKTKMRPLSPVCFTRWYRPPEICFRKTKYDEKSDMWSVGCIASEILQQSSKDTIEKASKVLFRGSSSYAISPVKTEEAVKSSVEQVSQNDQLFKIMEVMGP